MNEEKVIKEFLTKMINQDNRCTAYPIFYVIRTEVSDPAPLENCDETRVYWNSETYDSMEGLEKYLKENEYDEEDLKDALREACEYGVKKRWDKRCMFLTETDAERHLKLNHYHYSSNAHTYVEHAWRAPELEEFLSSLFKYFNIEKVKS